LKLNAKCKQEGTELKPGNESLQVKYYKFEYLGKYLFKTENIFRKYTNK